MIDRNSVCLKPTMEIVLLGKTANNYIHPDAGQSKNGNPRQGEQSLHPNRVPLNGMPGNSYCLTMVQRETLSCKEYQKVSILYLINH